MRPWTLFQTLCVVLLSTLGPETGRTETCSDQANVNLNILPATSPNVVEADPDVPIPVLVFGSAQLDVNGVDQHSLRLNFSADWFPSRVETGEERESLLCEIRDIGSYNAHYRDNLGPVDGHGDLLCQFINNTNFIRGGVEPFVVLTGVARDGDRGTDIPLFGFDSAVGPGGVGDVGRCCIDCDDDGNCSGCNGDFDNCANDFLVQCDGDTSCYDCTGCSAPEIC